MKFSPAADLVGPVCWSVSV